MKLWHLLLIMLLKPDGVFAAQDFAMRAMTHANAAMMASPPLPTPFSQKEGWTLSVRPAYFEVKQELNPQDPKALDYSGSGLAIVAHFDMTPSLSLFVQGFGNQLSGELSSPGKGNNPLLPLWARDVEAHNMQAAVGVSWDIIQNSALLWNLHGGPGMINTDVTQNIVNTDPDSPDDYLMKMKASTPGYMVGTQIAIRPFKYFAIAVYALNSGVLDEDDHCQPYTVEFRQRGSFGGLSSQECQDPGKSDGYEVYYDPTITAYGVNLAIPPWGISLNLYSETGEVPYFDGVKIKMLQFTLSI